MVNYSSLAVNKKEKMRWVKNSICPCFSDFLSSECRLNICCLACRLEIKARRFILVRFSSSELQVTVPIIQSWKHHYKMFIRQEVLMQYLHGCVYYVLTNKYRENWWTINCTTNWSSYPQSSSNITNITLCMWR